MRAGSTPGHHLEDESRYTPLDVAKYNVIGQINPVSGDDTPREFDPHSFKEWQEEWPEAAAAAPSVLDVATREDEFRAKLRIAARRWPRLASDLIHYQFINRVNWLAEERARVEAEEDGEDPEEAAYKLGGVIQLQRFGLEQTIRRILSIDIGRNFEVQTLPEVLGDLQEGYTFDVPDEFEPTPDFSRHMPKGAEMSEESRIICEATRMGIWLLYHYLGSKIEVDEKAAAGDFVSSLDLASDLASIYSLRQAYKGRVATETVLDKKRGLTIPPDDSAENIRARGKSPVFFLAEESSPNFDINMMEVGDTVIFDDGMDGSAAAKFEIPGGASVMIGVAKVALNEQGEKYFDLQSTSIMFPGSKEEGTSAVWYFAEKGKGAYVKRENGQIKKLDVSKTNIDLKDAHLLVNRYGDDALDTPLLKRLQKRARKTGMAWDIASATTVGLPSSEHGLKVVDPIKGHHISVSDNGPHKVKVGLWDLVTMLVVREAGGVVQDFLGNDVQIPSLPRPIIFARSQKLADQLREMVKTRKRAGK